jgi:hypothetical protein
MSQITTLSQPLNTLGVYFDENLNYTYHVKYISNKNCLVLSSR